MSALFESPRDKYTIFVSHISPKPLGGYSRQNGVSALGAFKTGQAHSVHEAVQILSSSSASNSTRAYYIPLIKGAWCSLEDISQYLQQSKKRKMQM
jgi:hypothetical protein